MRIFIAVPGAVVALALMAASGQAQNLAPPPGAAVIDLTPDPGYFNEPSIAINPVNPHQIVAAYQVQASVAYSEDSGEHWQIASGTADSRHRFSGDVSVAYDSRGYAILCYIAFDKLGTTDYWAHQATRNGIFVRRSADGGKTWEREAIPVVEHPTKPGIPFEDKPYIVADDTKGPFAGNLYVGWTEFTLDKSEILLSRSTDGGAHWSTPIPISTHPGLPRDDTGAVEGFTGAVGPDGTVYVVWSDASHVVFTLSHDGGQSFEPTRYAADTAAPYFKVSGVDRSDGFPEIGVDMSSKGSNRLYIAWSDYRNGDVDIFCSTSTDRGRTWTPAVRVNNDLIHNGADQFFQWLAVDPQDGAAYVVFYDRRADPDNRRQNVVLARSTDSGRTFVNYTWTQTLFDAADDFIGDYIGIAAMAGRVYGVWTEEQTAAGTKEKGRRNQEAEGSQAHHSVVRVGIADFGGSQGGN